MVADGAVGHHALPEGVVEIDQQRLGPAQECVRRERPLIGICQEIPEA